MKIHELMLILFKHVYIRLGFDYCADTFLITFLGFYYS